MSFSMIYSVNCKMIESILVFACISTKMPILHSFTHCYCYGLLISCDPYDCLMVDNIKFKYFVIFCN